MNGIAAFAQEFSPEPTGRTQEVAGESTASTSASADAGTITSSDFLTLLVTELKNQDPTSNQDPNAYINQLVQVNSLQQLISINQELAPPAGSATAAQVLPAAVAPDAAALSSRVNDDPGAERSTSLAG